MTCCVSCNAKVIIPYLNNNQHADCPRCNHTLASSERWELHRCAMIAYSILILLPFALNYPLLSINLLGVEINASVWQGIWKMATQGYSYTAFLIFLCAVFMPIAFSILVILLHFSQILNIKPGNLLLSLSYIKPWVMFDVYLVALAVTMFKIREYASLQLDIYLIAFIFTALLTTLLFIKINVDALWEDFYPEHTSFFPISSKVQLQVCTACQYSFSEPIQDNKGYIYCPRCYSRVTSSKISLQRTWATLITAMFMLIPANILPMSIVYFNGVATADTLMSGVLAFIDAKSYAIAFIVFMASIFIPICKIAVLLYLLCCIHFKWTHSIKRQMKLLHFIHFVGRWSMLDLFVLALMMSLVTRGQLIDFSVGPAAFYFGAAVFLSMISTSLFDSRLLWKIYDKH